jgi:hypothetical protein
VISIEVEENPNCDAITMVFREMGPQHELERIKIYQETEEKMCRVTGLDHEGKPCPAYARQVEDSGDGTAFLIYGGAWGVRFCPVDSAGDWDVNNPDQWGEAYKVYADDSDLFFKEGQEK